MNEGMEMAAIANYKMSSQGRGRLKATFQKRQESVPQDEGQSCDVGIPFINPKTNENHNAQSDRRNIRRRADADKA